MTQTFTIYQNDQPAGDVEVTVNFELIARLLGRKALKNSTGKSTAISGAVVVKVVKPATKPSSQNA